jgi:hypothetical protein
LKEGEKAMGTSQETCIKELGRKLSWHAHIIKRQRDAM